MSAPPASPNEPGKCAALGVVGDLPAGRALSGWERVRRALLPAGVVAIILLDFWLIAHQELVALFSPHDDLWFLEKARCWYWFDDGYSEMSFIKEAVYPLFIAVCNLLGVPLRLATEAVYLAAAWFLAWSLTQPRKPDGWTLLLFAALALHPEHYSALARALTGNLFAPLLMLALGALILQFKRRGQPGHWWRGLASGLALGLLWNTRPERPWLLALIVVLLAATAAVAWRRHATWRGRFRSVAGEWALPLGVLAAVTLALMAANYARWGVFALTDLEAPGFTSAQRALVSIRPERPLRYAPVTREARQRAYQVSPAFRELAPFLEPGPDADAYGQLPPGEYGGDFLWSLRLAVAHAGHCHSAADSEAYYYRVADQINAAAAAGRLPTRWVPFTSAAGFDPCLANWVPSLPENWCALWSEMWSRRGQDRMRDDDDPHHDYPVRHIQVYDQVACRRFVSRAPDVQGKIRGLIATAYGCVMNVALIDAGLVALAVLLLRRAAPGWRNYLLTGGVFAAAGLLSLGFLATYRAMFSPLLGDIYLFPTALLFTVLTVWLLSEGARLLAGAFRQPLPPVSSGASGGDSQWRRPPGHRKTHLISGLTVLVVQLVTFYGLHEENLLGKLEAEWREEPDSAAAPRAPRDAREVPFPVVPAQVTGMSWQDGTAKGAGYLVFALEHAQVIGEDPPLVYSPRAPRLVYGIRLTYGYDNTVGPACFKLYWRTRDRGDFDPYSGCVRWLDTGPGEHTTTVWINDAIDGFRVHPDVKPCAFRLSGITLIVPAAEPRGGRKPLLRTPYARAQALEPVTVETWEGKDVLRAHAPSAVEFDVPPRSVPHRITGKFGILPGAYQNAQDHTDGVLFAVEYTAGGEKPKVLFERFLDPLAHPDDQGMQVFDVCLPAGGQGTVVLKASNPPGKTEHLDWSCWAEVDIGGFQPRAATAELDPGSLDGADAEGISGWAWDKAAPNEPITVDLFDGDKLLATVRADQPRADLAAAGKGNGRHGFLYPMPAALKDGKVHTIRAVTHRTGIELFSSPKTFQAG
jgi:hypothetical protein